DHAVFKGPVLATLTDLHVDVLQAQAVEEDEGGVGTAHARAAKYAARRGLQLTEAHAWPHRVLERAHGVGRTLRHDAGVAARLGVHNPGFAAVPTVVLPRAVAVPHDVHARLDHEVFQT